MVKKSGIFLLIILYFLMVYTLFRYYNITCVFIEFFGIPCPGCGMTRALMALFNMDFIGAIKHNIVIFFMPYIFMYIFFDFKGKIHTILLVIIAAVTVVNWLIKIFI